MPGPTPVHTAVPVSVTQVELLDARPGRRSVVIFNDSTQALYIKYVTGVTADSFTIKIPSDWYGTMPWGGVFEGKIYGVWAGADAGGFAQLTELIN